MPGVELEGNCERLLGLDGASALEQLDRAAKFRVGTLGRAERAVAPLDAGFFGRDDR